MGTATRAELALQAEVRQLRERIAQLETEGQAARQDDNLSAVIAGIGDEVWFADAQKRFVLVNPAGAREFRLDATDQPEIEKLAAGLEVFRPDGTPRPVEEAPPLRALKGEVVRSEEEIIRTPATGELRYREVSATPVKDASGNIVGAVSVVRDITARKRAGEQAGRSSHTFSELVERAPFGIYLVDARFRIAHMNSASQAGAFRNVRPLIGREFSEAMRILWPEAVAAEIIAHFRHTLETGEPYYSPRFFNPRHDVEAVEGYEWELHRMTLPDGQYGVVCYYFDSTKLLQAEAALRESEDRLRMTLEAAQIGTFEFYPQTGKLIWNDHNKRIWGLKPGEEWTYPEAIQRVHPDDRQTVECAVAAALDPGADGFFHCDYRILLPDGTVHWTTAKGRVHFDGEGENRRALRATGIQLDLTDRKRSELEQRVLAQFPEQNPNPVLRVAPDAVVLYANAAARSWLAGMGVTGGRPLEGGVRALVERVLREGRVVEEEFGTGSGRTFWFLAVQPPGEVYVNLYGRDITERKQAEERLFETNQRLQALMEALPVGVSFSDDPTCQRITGNPAVLAQFGIGPEDNLSASAPDSAAPGRQVRFFREGREISDAELPLQQAVRYGRTMPAMELEVRLPGGQAWFAEASGAPVLDRHGKVAGGVAVSVDITERKRSEEALRQSEHQFRTLANAIPQLCWMANADGSIFWYNQRWYEYTGASAAEMEGWGWESVHDPEVLPKVLERWQHSVATGEPFDMVFPLRGADGGYRPFLTRIVPVRDTEGKVARWFGTNTDISEQLRTEEALKRQGELLRLSHDAMIVWKLDGAIESWNLGAERLYGYAESEVLGKVSHALLATAFPEPWDEIRAKMQVRGSWEGELRHRTRGGREVVVSTRLQLVRGSDGIDRVLEINRDITEYKQAEERLWQAQKLESLGLLAGGVAHDFNNLLVGVIGNGSLAQEMLPPDHPSTELIKTVVKTGEQAAHLTRQMLAYSGKGRFVLEPLSIPALVRDIIELVRPSIPKKVALSLELDEDLPRVEADRGQVQQILMNLAINAAEAIGSHDGAITVRTRTEAVDARLFPAPPRGGGPSARPVRRAGSSR